MNKIFTAEPGTEINVSERGRWKMRIWIDDCEFEPELGIVQRPLQFILFGPKYVAKNVNVFSLPNSKTGKIWEVCERLYSNRV